MNTIKRLFLLAAAVVLTFGATQTALAAPFANAANGAPGLLLAEVTGYGEHELQPNFLETFREEMADALNKVKDFNVQIYLSNGLPGEEKTGDDAVFALIHMDAVAHGPLFEIDQANAPMIRHARKRFGKEYFWDEEKMKQRRAGKFKPYRLHSESAEAAREMGQKYGVKYLLFCNLREVDARLKHSMFSSHVNVNEFRAKKLRTISNFYLVNTQTGMVYEGLNEKDKTSQILTLIGRYGQAATVQNLLQCLFEVQAEETVKDVCGSAKKALAK